KMGKARYAWTTVAPLLFMCAVTFSAGWIKIFSPDPKIGFLSGADSLAQNPAMLRQASVWRLDACVAGAFLVLVFLIVGGCALEWGRLLRGTKKAVLHESEFVRLTPAQSAIS
ncbi:MAG: carbon starvation protein A, partial [Verrucomicrobiota bacterium]|nr:carbon starvation protein A [Verrucomicrobiota bacterium]